MSLLATLFVYTLLSVGGLAMVKSASDIWSVQFMAGSTLYGLGFLIWFGILLRALPLSVGFPIAAGSLIVGTQIMGAFVLNETLSPQHLIGIALLILGLAVLVAGGERPLP
ncbi:hypothetical protein PB2503_11909 [Parvularcula bermudensis HTCC2503]|uniref:EamA domain-containing protein n=1 Tax=Parvularcula bermudensis (strain ATCC BAA-594 / HTCC2503 / KCTC 12087) TaxID=314260 RepID=E0TDX7_PARBH|nr:hypothetical protein [Parvularcula bermudensis]ADM10426.1 hypothetical protein PB2503_11909 [Parvularcula bermudensis HTCC2503]